MKRATSQVEPGTAATAGLAVLAVAFALFVYQPWRQAPFSVTDFCDFLPLLTLNHSFLGRLSAFIKYYAQGGRFNVIQYAYFVLEWSAFGWNAAAWHVSRFVEMCGMIVTAYLLLRRLTGSRSGALAGAGLFFVAACATQAWIRLTMGESLGLWAILGAAMVATRYQTSPRWRRSVVEIGVLMALAILAKEVLVVFVPYVLLLAWTFRAPARFERPERSRRNAWLVIGVGLVVAASLLPVAVIALRAHGNTYVGGFGHGSVSLSRAIGLYLAMFFPAYASYSPFVDFALPANFAFLAILALGWGLSRTDRETSMRRRSLAICLASVPLAGVVIYLPWPFFAFYYGLPFLVTGAILLAFSISFVEQDRPRIRWLAYAAYVVMFANAANFSAYDARHAFAVREINGALIEAIATGPKVDSLMVMKKVVQIGVPWGGDGQILSRFAASVYPDRFIPPGSDVLCPTIRDSVVRRSANHAIVVSYAHECGEMSERSWSTSRHFSYLYWPTLSMRSDSVRVDLSIR
jgi:hypothetical protein